MVTAKRGACIRRDTFQRARRALDNRYGGLYARAMKPLDIERRRAMAAGMGAIALWGGLATLSVLAGAIPPFQMVAMTFAVGASLGTLRARLRGVAWGDLIRWPGRVWLLGIGGLFGYHALYFGALQLAPPAEANLVNYLWPLLIVLLSSLLPGERLAPHNIIGAAFGFAGTILLFAGNSGSSPDPAHMPGFVAAFVAAFVWAGYSVMSRRFAGVPTDAVAGFCLATALLAAICHFVLETTVWPETAMQWLAVVALGIGPVGIAFFVWDIGMKRGDIRVLGAVSYATPVLSTGFLILAGFAKPTATLAIAAALIAGGGLIAAKDMIFRTPRT
jgi:drug/metabolite transporter (DMT)-like permease